MISQWRRPSDSGRVNTAILGGLPAAMKHCKNLSSISAEGVEAMIPSPRLRQYQLSILLTPYHSRLNEFQRIPKTDLSLKKIMRHSVKSHLGQAIPIVQLSNVIVAGRGFFHNSRAI